MNIYKYDKNTGSATCIKDNNNIIEWPIRGNHPINEKYINNIYVESTYKNSYYGFQYIFTIIISETKHINFTVQIYDTKRDVFYYGMNLIYLIYTYDNNLMKWSMKEFINTELRCNTEYITFFPKIFKKYDRELFNIMLSDNDIGEYHDFLTKWMHSDCDPECNTQIFKFND